MSKSLEIAITLVSNMGLIPSAVRCYRRKQAYQLVICLSTILTSILYHVSEILDTSSWDGSRILGMKTGQWHRLDNVFVILLGQSMQFHFADFKTPLAQDLIRWLGVVVCLFFQELSPWNIWCTIIPLLFALFIVIIKLATTQDLPYCDKGYLIAGTFFGMVAVLFFQRGLNERDDYLRLNHHLWHFFGGIGMWCFLTAKISDNDFRKIY